MALARDVRTIVIYTVSGSARNEYFVEAFTLKFNSGLRRPSNTDPLLECLTDVERLVEQLQSANADQATELKKNLVHYKEDVNSDMAVTVNQMSSTHYSYGNVKVSCQACLSLNGNNRVTHFTSYRLCTTSLDLINHQISWKLAFKT